jgi:hypothetical protein
LFASHQARRSGLCLDRSSMAQSGRADLSLQSNSLDWRQKNFTLLRADKNLCQNWLAFRLVWMNWAKARFFLYSNMQVHCVFPNAIHRSA